MDHPTASGFGEFHYRLPSPVAGYRPGAHVGLRLGSGQAFAAHARLFDYPEPRSIDLRASVRARLQDVRSDWLVRIHHQRTAVPVHAVVDVSPSMRFGATRPKLAVVADFVQAMGHSAYRAGDPAGLFAFDRDERVDLHVSARHSRAVGSAIGEALRACIARDDDAPLAQASGGKALARTVERLAGKTGLVFLVSDFHWPLVEVDAALDAARGALARASVVPIVVWDPAEIEPPADDGLLTVRDLESGARRSLWVGGALRERWRARVAERRDALESRFAAHGMRAFHLSGEFEPDALSRYFIEEFA